MRYLRAALLALLVLLPAASHARDEGETPAQLQWRRHVAAADMRLATRWIAHAWQIPDRVPQEMLLAGHQYADVLVAMGLVGQGASLNEVLEQRARKRWPQVAAAVSVDSLDLAPPVRDLMTFGRNDPSPPVLHFLPDVRPGLANRLRLPALSPTIPDPVAVERFRLSDQDIENIRKVLADPNNIPEDWLRLPAGPSLVAADWLIGGTIAHLKPFPIETLMETRVGQVIAWPDVASMFSVDAKVLTEGPLAAVYPIVTGVPPGTILAAHRLAWFPETMGLEYDLQRLVPSEKLALRPLMACAYGLTPDERRLLDDSGLGLELAEEAIALSLARMARLDLDVILGRRREGESWSAIIRRYALDMTGQEALLAAIRVREAR